MKKILLAFLLFVLPLSLASQVNYDIFGNQVLVTWKDNQSKIQFPQDSEILDNDLEKTTYVTSAFIEKNGDEYFFVVKDPNHIYSDIQIILPEGAILIDKYFVYPKNYTMETNGRNIVLNWRYSTEKEILIPYEIPTKTNWLFFSLSFVILIGIIYFIYFSQKMKIQTKTNNLYRDEKRIINYLLKKKECWTKEIVRDLGISKVKLSRKLRSLEEKDLIFREPHGNENRIKLK